MKFDNLPTSENIHFLFISETHLDHSFDDAVVSLHGYRMYRKDRNANGGDVAIYAQSHIPVRLQRISCQMI
jgi:hypothetical protein